MIPTRVTKICFFSQFSILNPVAYILGFVEGFDQNSQQFLSYTENSA